MERLNAAIILSSVFLLHSLDGFAQNLLIKEQVEDIRRYVDAQSELGALSGLSISIGSGSKAVFQQNHLRSGKIQIFNGGDLISEHDLPGIFPLGIHQVAVDEDRSRLGFLVQSTFTALNIQLANGGLIKCPELPFSPEARITALGGDFFVVVPGEQKVDLYKYQINEKKCTSKQLTSIPTENAKNFRIVADKESLHLFLERKTMEANASSYLEWHVLDQSGIEKKKNVFLDFEPRSFGDDGYTAPSVASNEVLIPLLNKKEDTRRPGLYLLKPDGSIKLVDRAGLAGWWLPDNEILIHRGTHAFSSKLVVAGAKDFKDRRTIFDEPSYQKFTHFNGEAISFLEFQLGRPTARARIEVSGKTEIKKFDLIPAPIIGQLPSATEVEYSQPEGSIPAVLLLPPAVGACKGVEKKVPAIVFVHGGSFETLPNGLYGEGESEALALAQMGYVVLQANYYGNKFLGEKYPSQAFRTMAEERARPQLRGLVAAGKFAQSLPCVDGKKVIYFGHSYGASLGGILFTDSGHEQDSPYRAAVLKSGYPTEANSDVLLFPNKPALAGRASLKVKQRCFGKKSKNDCPNCVVRSDSGLVLREIEKVDDALDDKFCEEFLDSLIAVRRAASVHPKTALFLINSTNDGALDTQRFERELKKYNPDIRSWYPEDAGHNFSQKLEADLVERVKVFIDGLK